MSVVAPENVEDLPKELFWEILRRLDHVAWLLNARAVSKRWLSVISVRVLRKTQSSSKAS